MSLTARSQKGSGDTEQRYLPRWEVNNRVYFYLEHDAKTYQGTTRDLSACGTCIVTSPLLPLQDKIKMTIHLTVNTSFETIGRIVWSKTIGDEMMLGIIFDNPTQRMQDTILEHAFEINKAKVVNQWFKGWE